MINVKFRWLDFSSDPPVEDFLFPDGATVKEVCDDLRARLFADPDSVRFFVNGAWEFDVWERTASDRMFIIPYVKCGDYYTKNDKGLLEGRQSDNA